MTEPTRNTLLIFIKPPVIGLAKTRLAKSLGSRAEARRISRFTTARTLRAAFDPRWTMRLYIAPDSVLNATLGGLWPAHLPRFSQGSGDLSDRLERGFHEAPRGKVLFIGGDAPDISNALIWRAFQALNRHDCVVGPASDGGFWLIGLHRHHCIATPFRPVRWSGPHALTDTVSNLPANARIARLPTLIDIDEADDWKAWNRTQKSTGS